MSKRHLPVLNSPSSEGVVERSTPAWRGVAAALTFVCFLPLSMLAGALGRSLVRAQTSGGEASKLALAASIALPTVLAFLLAAAIAGAVLGRFAKNAGPRDAGVGAGLAAAAVCVLALLGGAFHAPWLGVVVLAVLAVVGVPSAVAAARMAAKGR